VRAGRGGAGLVVSVHDVTPSTLPGVAWLLQALDNLGVRPRSLLVVPAEGGRPISRSPQLCSLVRREAAAGSEVVVHGFTHRAAGPARGGPATRLRARLLAGREAEFCGLDGDEAARRALAGRRLLERLGLEPEGFCAPCWLSPPEAAAALARAGFRFQVGMASLTDLSRMRRRRLRWLGYMGAGAAQEALIAGAGQGLLRCPGLDDPVQVFLHPQGAERSRACRLVLRTLADLASRQRLVRYRELVGQ
jgi:predicted deacetylase